MPRMNAYSEDLRKKIIEALRWGTTKTETAHAFGVSRSSVKRYAKMAEEGRPLAPKKRPGSKPKIDERARRLLEADVQERPSATLSERCEYLQIAAGVRESDSTVSRKLRRLGWSRRKDPDPTAGTGSGDGQPLFSQGREGARDRRGSRLRAHLPASLLAGLQSDRAGILEGQGADAPSRSAHPRIADRGDGEGAHGPRRPRLLRELRLP
jgi:transposase